MAHGPWPTAFAVHGKLVMAKWRMAIGQIAHEEMTHALMAHGKLHIDKRECDMGNGKWEVGSSQRQMANGRGKAI